MNFNYPVYLAEPDVPALFAIGVSAAETAVAIAIIINIYRHRLPRIRILPRPN